MRLKPCCIKTIIFLALIASQLYPICTYGQNDTAVVNKTIQTAQRYFTTLPSEKLYLFFDKPYYTPGDTLRFKSYLLNSATLTPGASVKLYVELLYDTNKLVTRVVIPMSAGLGEGFLAINGRVNNGTYKIRAYTNWMQNFGETSFFYHQFIIGKPVEQLGWTITERHSTQKTNKGGQVNMAVQLIGPNNMPVAYRDVEVSLINGSKTLMQHTKTTSGDGEFTAGFILPEKTNTRNLTLTITDKSGKNDKLYVPFYPGNYLQDIDMQFLPEGGNMVGGLYNKVAFKAIGDNGKAVELEGVIRNSKNEDVAGFRSLHNGMGSFMLLPQPGEKYIAVLNTIDGFTKTVALPEVKTSGIALRVDNTSSADSVNVYITTTTDVANANETYTLLAQAKDAIFFGKKIDLSRGFNNFRIAKNRFKTGIVSFVLLNHQNTPVNERRIFIDLKDNGLNVAIEKSKYTYQPKDSISVTLQVKDTNGKPAQGNFVLSVTDDGVISDKPYPNYITSHFLLTSEVRGNIEEPGWYFLSRDSGREKALDNLLLTQGWTGYNWLTEPAATAKFEAETDTRVSGTLFNIFNKPIKNARVTLYASSKKYGTIAIDTVTNTAGKFVFANLPLFDTIAYSIKAHSAKGKAIGAKIVVDEFKPAEITIDNILRPVPWYAKNNDSLMIKYFRRPGPIALQGLNANDVKGKLLKEVVIKAPKKRITIGDEDGFPIKEIGEQELIAARKKSLLTLLFEKFTSFRETYIYSYNTMQKAEQVFDQNRNANTNFCIGSNLIYDVFIDGKSMRRVNGSYVTHDSTTYYNALKEFFNYVGADDVKDVKIVSGYHMFMTITTRSGAGPFTQTSAGNLAYRPLPMLFPKQFYSPRYTVDDKGSVTDYRTTMFWEPNLVSDKNGKATFYFYAGDKPSTYTIRIEGTDMNGNFGYQTSKIQIMSQAQ